MFVFILNAKPCFFNITLQFAWNNVLCCKLHRKQHEKMQTVKDIRFKITFYKLINNAK